MADNADCASVTCAGNRIRAWYLINRPTTLLELICGSSRNFALVISNSDSGTYKSVTVGLVRVESQIIHPCELVFVTMLIFVVWVHFK